MKRFTLSILFTASVLLLTACGEGQIDEVKQAVFSSISSSKTINDALLDNPSVKNLKWTSETLPSGVTKVTAEFTYKFDKLYDIKSNLITFQTLMILYILDESKNWLVFTVGKNGQMNYEAFERQLNKNNRFYSQKKNRAGLPDVMFSRIEEKDKGDAIEKIYECSYSSVIDKMLKM